MSIAERVQTRHVEAQLTELAMGSVKIDGHDISDQVARFTVDAVAKGDQRGTRVYIETTVTATDLVVDGEVIHKVETNVGAEILQFLENVDVNALEIEAMNKLDGLNGDLQSPTAAMVLVLQEWAVQAYADNGT